MILNFKNYLHLTIFVDLGLKSITQFLYEIITKKFGAC